MDWFCYLLMIEIYVAVEKMLKKLCILYNKNNEHRIYNNLKNRIKKWKNVFDYLLLYHFKKKRKYLFVIFLEKVDCKMISQKMICLMFQTNF